MVLAFFARRNTIVLLVKNKTIIIIVVYLNPPQETYISMQNFKNIFIKYLDSKKKVKSSMAMAIEDLLPP